MSRHQYECFHGMVCSPSTAQKCIHSFVSNHNTTLLNKDRQQKKPNDKNNRNSIGSGSILFLPSNYSNDEIHVYDCCHTLTIVTYYALVLLSFTGLSTLLGLTDIICSEEYVTEQPMIGGTSNTNNESLLSSTLDPSICVRPSVLDHLQKKHILTQRMDNTKKKEKDESTTVHLALKRKFEYDFRLIGLNVIMLHIVSYTDTPSTTTSTLNRKDEVLHLVEVYRFRNALLRFIMKLILNFFNTICQVIIGTTKSRKEKSVKKHS